MYKLLLIIFINFLFLRVALAGDIPTVKAIVSQNGIIFVPTAVVENTPFMLQVVNNTNSPLELENADTSVEIYAGNIKTFKVGLAKGQYKFFNDFNQKTPPGYLKVVTQSEIMQLNNSDNLVQINSKPTQINGPSSINEIIFIIWRESIEALLVVGVVFAWLKKIPIKERKNGMLCLGIGVFTGVIVAIGIATILTILSGELSSIASEYLQVGMTFLATIMIVYMVKWMRNNGRRLKSSMHDTLNQPNENKWNYSIIIVTALAVAREGSEAVIFIYALGFGAHGIVTGTMLIGIISGILLAIATVYILSLGSKLFSWQYFFKITEVILLLLGGALLLNGVDTLVTMGFVPVLKSKIWDTSVLISDGGMFGPLLSSVFGYRATPSLMDIIIYVIYWAIVVYLLRIRLFTFKLQR